MKQQLKVILLAAVVLIGIVAVAGCVSSSPTATPTVPTTPTAAPVATATPAPTAAPAKAQSTGTDYSKAIEQNWVSQGYSITTPFVKTTVDGREAYQGAVTDSNGTYHITEVLTSTIADAQSYASARLSGFESQGYTVVSNSDGKAILTNSNGDLAGVAQYSLVYGTNSPGVGIIEA